MDRTELCYTSALELARLIRSRKISPVEIVKAVLDRIEALQPTVNAYVTIRREEALADALKAEARALNDELLGPLDGIPFSAKDLIWTKDLRTTFGSHIYADFIPPSDAPSVGRLRAAGAVLIGKTTTSEFAHKALTDSPFSGITRNPWLLDRSPGGSSGGAAAAVAAGLGPLALGSDGGGSIRIPASCTGVVGFKPSLGRVPHPQAPDVFGNLSYIGPMTRTVADTALVMDVISGPDQADPHSIGLNREDFLSTVTDRPADLIKGLKIAWAPKMGNTLVDDETLDSCLAAVDCLASLGAEIQEIVPDFTPQEEVFLIYLQASLTARLKKYVDEYSDLMDRSLLVAIERGQGFSAIQMQEGIQKRTQLYQEVQRFFEGYDLFVSPTLARPALPVDHYAWDPVEVNGQIAGSMRSAWYPYTHPFNMSANPAISIPCGWTGDNLPVGFQIVGRLLSERTVLGAAAALETIRPWTQNRPPIKDPYSG